VCTSERTEHEFAFSDGAGRSRFLVVKPGVIHVDRDGVRLEHAVEMFRLIPHTQLAIFPNADHFMIFMQPEKLQSAIVAFLDAPGK
jgi:pimeloyl-ACP methyl ester carboxylesterase